MSTDIVSGRVDSDVKAIADAVLREQGFTSGEVISAVWEHIAETGEVPRRSATKQTDGHAEAIRTLRSLRAKSPFGTSLATMTDADLKEVLTARAEGAA